MKQKRSISTQHDIEETSISKFKTSISFYPDIEENVDIEVQNFDIVISRYRRFLDINKCSFDVCIRCRSFLIRYRMSCSSISVFLCLVCCSSCSFRDPHCRVHVWPVAYAGPAACNDAKFKFGDDGPVRSQHSPQPPERGSAAGAAAAAAGAGINGTQESVTLGDNN